MDAAITAKKQALIAKFSELSLENMQSVSTEHCARRRLGCDRNRFGDPARIAASQQSPACIKIPAWSVSADARAAYLVGCFRTEENSRWLARCGRSQCPAWASYEIGS